MLFFINALFTEFTSLLLSVHSLLLMYRKDNPFNSDFVYISFSYRDNFMHDDILRILFICYIVLLDCEYPL